MQETTSDNKQEGMISKFGPLAASLLLVGGIIWGTFAFATNSSTTAVTANTTASVIATAYTNTTANVRKCGSTTCASVGTYDRGTPIDISAYNVTDFSQLPDWVSFTYSEPNGTSATGYISKSVLSETESSATDVSFGDVATNQAQQTSAPSHTTGLPAIIKEWRPSTAYLECYWDYAGTAKWYYKQSGSGLLVSFNSVPTVITNKHVVYNSQYGMPQECDVAFPDDKYIFYSIETADIPAHPSPIAGLPDIPEQPANGQIQFTADGSDVAYISGFKENKVDSSDVPHSLFGKG